MKQLSYLGLVYVLLVFCFSGCDSAGGGGDADTADTLSLVYQIESDDTVTITGCTGSGSTLVVPSTIDSYPVRAIGNSACAYNDDLIEIELPSGLTSIGEEAFRDCSSLETISIPSSVVTIGDYAFDECVSLASAITIPEGITSIGRRVFYHCGRLTSVTLPDNLTSIGYQSFYRCSLSSITIPDSVTELGYQAFLACPFTRITIPANVSSIGNSAFYGCDSLEIVFCKPTSPPALGGDSVFDYASGIILVPSGSVTAYQGAAYWSEYATKIAAEP